MFKGLDLSAQALALSGGWRLMTGKLDCPRTRVDPFLWHGNVARQAREPVSALGLQGFASQEIDFPVEVESGGSVGLGFDIESGQDPASIDEAHTIGFGFLAQLVIGQAVAGDFVVDVAKVVGEVDGSRSWPGLEFKGIEFFTCRGSGFAGKGNTRARVFSRGPRVVAAFGQIRGDDGLGFIQGSGREFNRLSDIVGVDVDLLDEFTEHLFDFIFVELAVGCDKEFEFKTLIKVADDFFNGLLIFIVVFKNIVIVVVIVIVFNMSHDKISAHQSRGKKAIIRAVIVKDHMGDDGELGVVVMEALARAPLIEMKAMHAVAPSGGGAGEFYVV